MKRNRQQGFTLVELALVMGISVMVAAGLAAMLQIHMQVMSRVAKYHFLAQDAPFVGLVLTKTIGNAEDYRIYSSGSVARSPSGTPCSPPTGPAVRLWMRQPNSTFRQVVVSFETVNGNPGLYFFLANSNGQFSAGPNWEIVGSQITMPGSSGTVQTGFDATTGVLLVTLVGPNNEWYKFAAEKK
jgi:prepilin-type N-terminal cleavage/methylation domain-containing protein